MMDIEIASGSEARRKILAGAVRVGQLVGMSLGPRGRTAIIKTKYSAPQIHHDGVSIAREIMLKDDIEDLGAQTLIEGCMKVDERAHDGTTTAVVISSTAVDDYAKRIEEEDKASSGLGTVGSASETSNVADVNGMAQEILEAGKFAVEKLKKMAVPLGKKDLRNVVATSLGSLFTEYVDEVTNTVEEVGVEGYISVEDNWHTQYGIETELVKGARYPGTYATFKNVNTSRKEAVYEDVAVIVCNYSVATTRIAEQLIKQVLAKGVRKIVWMAEKFETAMVKQMAATVAAARVGDTRMIDYLCVKMPSNTTEKWEDIAIFCGASFFDKNVDNGEGLKGATLENLGFLKKIVVNEDEVVMVGGGGDKKQIEARLQLLRSHVETEKDPSFKEQTLRRVGSLQAGFAVIRVGASTEMERIMAKKKIEDAVGAAKCALEEGVLPGGGQALRKIADELGKKHSMYRAFCAPYEQIQRSLGDKTKIAGTVLDPLKVTRIAVETACSVASSLITAEVGIAEHRKTLSEELTKMIYPREDDEENFRQNREVGYK